jgi:putative oxidoreductase
MKITTIIVRTLIGLLMLFVSLSYFFKFSEQPQATGDLKIFMDGLMASKYLMPFAKSVELICGLSFVTGKFVKISAVILVPITLNILLINVFLMPEGIPIAAVLFLGNLFLIYSNWNSYKDLFTA